MPAIRKDKSSAASLTEHHLLILDPQIAFDEVEFLALTRYPHASWVDDEVLQLSRHSSLRGPVTIDSKVAGEIGIDPELAGHSNPKIVFYVANCPVERGDPPLPGIGDRDGISRAFPEQMPHMEEGRIVDWLIATARRLGGAVRAAGSGAILRPEPLTAVDLTVHTDVWLDPEAALAVIRQVLPGAFIDNVGAKTEPPRSGRRSAWSSVAVGADPSLSELPPPGAEGLDMDELAEIHQLAQLHDAQALANPIVLESYAIRVPLSRNPESDGECYVVVGGESEVPQALAGLEWASEGVITYEIVWSPVNEMELHVEFPSAEHIAARGRVIPLIGAVAFLLHEAVGGEIIDMDGFLVAASDLLPSS